MAKKIGDMLALGLFLISLWIFTSLLNVLPTISIWSGIGGSVILMISQGWFFLRKVKKK
jgi:hypothetical protein